MPSFSKITLIGHVGKITSRFTPNGKLIIRFSVAVNRYRGGEKYTDWFYVFTFQDWVNDKLEVGDLVFIEGVPEMSESDGKRYMNIRLNKLRILTHKRFGDA